MKLLALASSVALVAAVVASDGESTAQSPVTSEALKPGDQKKPDDQRSQSDGPLRKQFAQIAAEFEAQTAGDRQFDTKSDNVGAERNDGTKRAPDLVAYSRRMLDLAESNPVDLAARDALLWVVNTRGTAAMDMRAHRDQTSRAAELLVRHHSDDAEAVRIGLTFSNVSNFRRDALFFGFYAGAVGREAKGLARLALANYLNLKAKYVVTARSVEGRPKRSLVNGGQVIREFDLTNEEYADHLALRQFDPEAIRAEAERLYQEVITEYNDIPYITWRQRELQALLRAPAPQRNGKPLTDKNRRSIEASLAKLRSLGEEATERLDAMVNLAPGSSAPEIIGLDMDGKTLRLSDYKGKVVALVFWGSWCEPCLALVPRELELLARLKGQPFALLGVDCKDDRDAARGTMLRKGMTWPSWYDGTADRGPIAQRYHVRSYPAIFIIDSDGIIRARNPFRVDEDLVDKLLNEMKRPAR